MPDRSTSPNSRGWHGGAAAPTAGRPTARRRGKVLAVAAVMLLLAGTIAGLLVWLRPIPPPHFVALWIDQYDDPQVPMNAWAAQDREALLSVPWEEKNAFARQERHLLLAELRGLQARSDRPVVVYLCAFAAPGDNGEVCVLPGDARLSQPSTWLPLGDVFQQVRACRAAHRLLILDIMRPLVSPRHGLLRNDIAERAVAAVQAALTEDPSLLVLLACSPGQTSLDMGEMRQSAFGYYLKQGLRGRADGCNDKGKRDGRVSARELAAFVGVRVDRWAESNRDARQTPVLLGEAKDFPLVGVYEADSDPEMPAAEPYPDWLRAGWALLDERRGTTGLRLPPDDYRRLERTLVSGEEQWRGGGDAARIRLVVETAADQFRRRRGELTGESREPRSLAEAAAKGRKPPDLADGDLLTRFRDLAELDARLHAAKPDDKEKDKQAKEKEKQAGLQKEFLKPFEGKPLELSWAIFEILVGQPSLRPEHVRCAHDLLSLSKSDKPGQARPDLAEVQFLERLAGWTRTVKENWPADAVHSALLAKQEAERAALAGPRARPWISQRESQAAKLWQAGEGLLLSREPASWEKARPVLRDALREYQVINRAGRVLDDGYRCRDDALALLPGYTAYLESDRSKEEEWKGAVLTAASLKQALARPEPADPAFTELLKKTEELTATLRDQLNRLAQPLAADRWKRMIAQADHGSVAHARELHALLDSPWLAAADREAISKGSREWAARLQRDALARDAAEDRAHRATAALPAFDGARAARQEQERALARARVSILLLGLKGTADIREAEQALARATAEPTSDAAWQALGSELRRAWNHTEEMHR